jgi:hypothetical protein
MRGQHGNPWLRQVEELDLRPEQREQLDAVHATLKAKLEPSRREAQELAALLANGIEKGKVDDAAVKAKRESIDARVTEARAAFIEAANTVHATLDESQRTELVLTLRAHREGQRTAKEVAEQGEKAEHHRGMGHLASELGLSDSQQKSLREGARTIFETAFPERNARREAMEAEIKAAEDAFMSDDFDASRYTFGKESVQFFHTAAGGAAQLSDLAATVLTQGQRAELARKIRGASQHHQN